jgi:glycosyltransferase involved in cell wall biosynthesis
MHVLINAVSASQHPSGICRHAANLARALALNGEITQVTLLAGAWQTGYLRSAFGLKEPKLHIVSVHIANHSLERNLWYWSDLPKKVKTYSPDIVHLSFPVPFRHASFPCPIVVSLHDLYPYDIPENFGYPRVVFNRLFLRQSCRAGDLVVCGSEFTFNRLSHFMPRIADTKAVRIDQCVDLDPAINSMRPMPEVCHRPFVLTVAQHRSNKNLGLLFSALAELRRRNELHADLCLVVVGGNGPETGCLKRLAERLSLQRHIVFKASVKDEELCWLYRNCELCVAPSSIEGFGLPVVEALRCGSRVLCSDIPAFREVGGTACHYFSLDSDSPVMALADGAYSAMQGAARVSTQPDRFSPTRIAAQYVAAYSKLIVRGVTIASALPIATGEPVHHDSLAS